MNPHGEHGQISPEKREMPRSPAGVLLMLVGVAVIVGAFFLARTSADGASRFWFAYLLGYTFFLGIALCALLYVMLQHMVRAGASVVVRRVAEVLAGSLPLMAVLFLPIVAVIVAGRGELYRWATWKPADAHQVEHDGHAAGSPADADHHVSTDPHPSPEELNHGSEHDAHAGGVDPVLAHKRPYLNIPFFLVRWGIYLSVWCGLASYFWRSSLRQDFEGDALLTVRLQQVGAPGLLALGLTVTFAAFDLLMSLDAYWYSTIFGVYFLAGGLVAFFSAFILILALLQRAGLLTSSVTAEHYHDLGKYLFGFVFFWGYIAFAQYMLIWYGNIPVETVWLMRRGAAMQAPNVFSPVFVALLFGNLLIPFAGLISRHAKRRKGILCFWAVWLLAMHWVDLYWLIMPEFTTDRLPVMIELLCVAGLGLIFAGAWLRRAAGRPLIPLADPRLGESLAFHNF